MTETNLENRVHIARRFQRAIRIDADVGDDGALKGFVCPESSAEVLSLMARHVTESGQGAFTWTGPYGSGKSSLIVALSALFGGRAEQRAAAHEAIGEATADKIMAALPPKKHGWNVLPVVGRREAPAKVIGDALEHNKLVKRSSGDEWTEDQVIETLSSLAQSQPRSSGGLLVFIDEMGKFLEAAATDGSDIYLFQQLAEAASRSGGRLILVGVLHQSFEEYANRLSRQMRDEWAKIQGRFVDLAVNVAGEEQIDLIARAIESDHAPDAPSTISTEVAQHIQVQKKGVSNALAGTLEACWPLHPVVACLLGPISRRRFGQNQRSIFGFLNSAEPGGFRDFLANTSGECLYTADRLWDYLRLNLEPSILASPDGHRWALTAEAVERCEGMDSEALHVRLLKTIAVIDLFKERSGLLPSVRVLQTCFPEHNSKAIEQGLAWLQRFSLIIYKQFVDAYAVYAGSDFDIDAAVEAAREELQSLDFEALRGLTNLQPLLAKRHYHATGALRWFDVDLAPLKDVEARVAAYRSASGAIGEFVLAIPTEGEDEHKAGETCRKAARLSDRWDVVIGLSARSWRIPDLGIELLALDKVRTERPELAGDAVARREVRARLSAVQTQLEAELYQTFNTAQWYVKHRSPKRLSQFELNTLASELADRRFDKAPILHNELLNRTKPSPNARAGQNALLRRMVLNTHEPRLGIEGFPPEGGLYVSLLEQTGLHQKTDEDAVFASPLEWRHDPYQLRPLWREAIEYLKTHADRTVPVGELYDLWRAPPYGMKDGVMPVFAVAFLLSMQDKLAIYREGVFQAQITDLDIDYLAKDPWAVQFRWMDLTETTRHLLSGMAGVVRELDGQKTLENLQPIDVARALVAIYDRLPNWTKRTAQLSANAKRIRDLFKRASDPNKFLFDDLPVSAGQVNVGEDEPDPESVIASVREGLTELVEAYPTMLRRMRDTMFAELQVPNDAPQTLAELRERAENVRQLAGDFRLDAFVGRLTQFHGTDTDIEGVVGLAANKPSGDCVDPDIDRAAIELADLARRFVRAEAFAHVKGRADKRHAMAVIVGTNGDNQPVIGEFDVADHDQAAVDRLCEKVTAALNGGIGHDRNVILAALAKLSAQYLDNKDTDDPSDETPRRVASS